MSGSIDDAALEALSLRVGRSLEALGWRLATAESCTGGWLAKCLTDIPGSSRWFERGYVTYSNAAKAQALGVSAEVIETFGAVSRPTAEQMATGALHVSGADLAIAVTGIAGPDGGSVEKPVGLVWFSVAQRVGRLHTQEHRFAGDRAAVRRSAVATALALVAAAVAGAAVPGHG